MTDKTPEFIWAIDKVDLGQYVHRDTHQALEAERDHARKGFSLLQKEYEQVIRGRSKLREALDEIQGMGFDMPMTLELTEEQWARRRASLMQQIARAALGETEICGYCKGGTDENVTHCPVCEGDTEK